MTIIEFWPVPFIAAGVAFPSFFLALKRKEKLETNFKCWPYSFFPFRFFSKELYETFLIILFSYLSYQSLEKFWILEALLALEVESELNPIPTGHGRNQHRNERQVTKSGRNRVEKVSPILKLARALVNLFHQVLG